MAPRIITARALDLHFQNVFGSLGPELYVTGHWSAGHVPRSLKECIGLVRTYHVQHKNQGWGGLGYHYVIAPDGTILCGRPTSLKGAHVGGHNSNNIGIMLPGGAPGHVRKPTVRQRRALRWLIKNAHTTKMPAAHRTERPLIKAEFFGHNSWSGHTTNACPGTYKRLFKTKGTAR